VWWILTPSKLDQKVIQKVEGFLRPFEEKLEVVFVQDASTSDF